MPTRATGPKPCSQANSSPCPETRGRELGHPEQPAKSVHGGSHVQVQVGVHAAGHRPRRVYDRHSHPFLSFV